MKPGAAHSASQPFPPTALRRRHAQTVRDSFSSYKIHYFIVIPKNIKIPSVVQKLRLYSRSGFFLLVELHREVSAPAAGAAGLFTKDEEGYKLVEAHKYWL